MTEEKQILENIIADFSDEKFIRFFREKSRRFAERQENLSHFNNEDFANGKKLGEIKFESGDELLVCVFKVGAGRDLPLLSERSGKKAQYEKAKEILKNGRNFSAGIFVFYDPAGNFRFSLVYPESIGAKRQWNNFRRFTYFVSKEFTNKTFLNQIGDGDFSTLEDIKDAFSVEKVTKEFFGEYVALFRKIKGNLLDQKISGEKECHDCTLQLLNRIMFLYFVQKKKWLGDDDKFLRQFWNEYKKSETKNEFFNKWIKVLFFEAFNNKFSPKNYFSGELNSALQEAPYLNGGLFVENKLDEISFKISDAIFEDIFGFFEQYNFTIQESSSVDIDLEIDPKLIGDVYESLVNVSDEDNEKQERGIFYTDRTEIKFMSGITLAEYFSRYAMDKEFWLNYFFSEDEDRQKAIEKLNIEHWQKIKKAVEELSIVDPACGSGSFLVVMLELVSEIYKLSFEKLKIKKSDYEIKKFVIANCLYGVDVKKWAVDIAELRLWLQLVVYAELDLGQRMLIPLLPNLTFKIRQGDSLTQELAGIDLSSRNKTNFGFDSSLKRKITELKKEKIKFTNNEKPRKYLTAGMVENEEKRIYKLILDSKIKILQSEIIKIKNEKYTPPQSLGFAGYEADEKEQEGLFDKQNKQKIIQFESEIEKIREVRNALNEKKPFVWDIDFVEIFSDENEKGFDIVIGNPPYVRQEKIADPFLNAGEITTENKKEYKEKLARSIETVFPFVKKIDKKSDLYIYFYFYGLSLLNSEGIFCFITSNSWLDVRYGKDLQKFLLENVKIKAIYDNSAKRSFASADVNTVISLFSAPNTKDRKSNLDNAAKFAMFKKPFEEISKADILIDLENAGTRNSDSEEITSNDNFRVFAKKQADLLEEGIEYKNEGQKALGGEYVGDKWGGKYLRAPKFILDILVSSKVEPFLNVVDIKYGVKPGKVKFFYLNKNQAVSLGIEKEFLKPAIISSQHINTIFINSTHFIFSCLKSKKDLLGTKTLDYIKWGKANKMNIGASVESHRPFWYSLQCEDIDTIFFRFWDKRFFSPIANVPMCCSDNFCYGKFKKNEWAGKLIVNSTFYFLQIELFGNSNQGQGILTTYMEYDYPFIRMPILANDNNKYKNIIEKLDKREVKSIFKECGIDPKSKTPIEEQEPRPLSDRAELDKIVFDALGLSEPERKEVYRAVCRLVWNRISKARSV